MTNTIDGTAEVIDEGDGATREPPNKHQPDEQSRQLVSDLAVAGIPQERIGRILGMTAKTLRKHYRDELDTALDTVIGKVASTLVGKALRGDTTSMIFFLKVRGGEHWKENKDSGLDAAEVARNLKALSDQAAKST